MLRKAFVWTVCLLFLSARVALCAVNRAPIDGNSVTFKYQGETYVLHMEPLKKGKGYVVNCQSMKTKNRGKFYIYTGRKAPRVVACNGEPLKYKKYEAKTSSQFRPGTMINAGNEIKFCIGGAIALGIAIGFLAWCLQKGNPCHR